MQRFRESLRPMIRKELALDAVSGLTRSTGTEYAGNKVSGTGIVGRVAQDVMRKIQQTRQQAR